MRGVVTAGMASGLELLGLRDVFDVVFGASSGAANGAFWVAGQGVYGTTTYYDWLSRREFIDLRRPLERRPVLLLEYVLGYVFRREVVFDWAAFKGSPVELRVIAADMTGQAAVLSGFRDQDDLFEALRASASIPLVAGLHPAQYRGRALWDAAAVDAYGINSAAKDGCTHLVVLRSRPAGAERQLNLFERLVTVPYLRRYSAALADAYRWRFDPEVNGLAYLERSRTDPNARPRAMDIQVPGGTPTVGRLASDRRALVDAARTGMAATFAALGLAEFAILDTLAAFDRRGHVLGPWRPAPSEFVDARLRQ